MSTNISLDLNLNCGVDEFIHRKIDFIHHKLSFVRKVLDIIFLGCFHIRGGFSCCSRSSSELSSPSSFSSIFLQLFLCMLLKTASRNCCAVSMLHALVCDETTHRPIRARKVFFCRMCLLLKIQNYTNNNFYCHGFPFLPSTLITSLLFTLHLFAPPTPPLFLPCTLKLYLYTREFII